MTHTQDSQPISLRLSQDFSSLSNMEHNKSLCPPPAVNNLIFSDGLTGVRRSPSSSMSTFSTLALEGDVRDSFMKPGRLAGLKEQDFL